MDYPHPNVFVNDKGAIDFSDINTNEIGEWDKRAITYGYQDFDKSLDESKALKNLLIENSKNGYNLLLMQMRDRQVGFIQMPIYGITKRMRSLD